MSKLKKFLCAFALFATASTFASVQKIDTENFANPTPETQATVVVEPVTIFADGTRLSKVKTRGITALVLQDLRGRVIRSQIEGASQAYYLHYDDDSTHGVPVAASTENLVTGIVSYRVLPGVAGDSRKSFALIVQNPDDFDFASFSFITEDPFGQGWELIGLNAQQPARCRKDACKELCDAGADVGFVGCGMMTLVPGPGTAAGAVCAGVMLGGKYTCRARCDDRCTSLGE